MNPLNPQHERVFAELSRHLGSEPPGEAFELAIEKRVVSEYQQSLITIDDLAVQVQAEADTIVKLRDVRARNRSRVSKSTDVTVEDHRSEALTQIFALEAQADPIVRAFRLQHLEQGLLDIDEVTAWIRATAVSDGDPTVLITMPEEVMGKGNLPADKALNMLPGYREDTVQLHYLNGEAQQHRMEFIRIDGVLGDLNSISQRICRRYDWAEAAATTYILTGVPPTQRGIQIHAIDPWPWPAARRRVAMDVPLNATPTEVADLYSRARTSMLGGEPIGRKSLSKHAADLAVFAAEHSTGGTWNEARAMWNRQQSGPDSRHYDQLAQFIRDSRAAYKRITGRDLDWVGKQSSGTMHATTKET